MFFCEIYEIFKNSFLYNSPEQLLLTKIIKPINSETNNKSPGNDGLTAEFYKHFSNELAPVLLDVYDS